MALLLSFIKKLNWRHILIHFLAIWSFITSFKYFSYLYDTRLFKIIIPGNSSAYLEAIKTQKIFLTEIVDYAYVVNSSWLLGLLSACIISLVISLRKHWFWVNSLLSFLAVFIVNIILFKRGHPEGYFAAIYNNPIPLSVTTSMIIGLLCLTIGCWLFFSRFVNNFISTITNTLAG